MQISHRVSGKAEELVLQWDLSEVSFDHHPETKLPVEPEKMGLKIVETHEQNQGRKKISCDISLFDAASRKTTSASKTAVIGICFGFGELLRLFCSKEIITVQGSRNQCEILSWAAKSQSPRCQLWEPSHEARRSCCMSCRPPLSARWQARWQCCWVGAGSPWGRSHPSCSWSPPLMDAGCSLSSGRRQRLANLHPKQHLV